MSVPEKTTTYRRFIGIDAGAENLKIVELLQIGSGIRVGRREIVPHGKRPGPALCDALRGWEWDTVDGATVTGRYAAQVNLPRIPTKQVQLRGYRHYFGEKPATIVEIGSHGFSVLEVRANGGAVFRENSRCSQGTGNFLCQLVERFSLSVEEASALCADVQTPAPLSGRCPVILKTDMTHLANKGEDRARILAGLFDAVCENVLVLIRPGVSPPNVLLTGGVCRSVRIRRVMGESLARQGMSLLSLDESDALFLEALGAALTAAESRSSVPKLADLLLPPRELKIERLPALADSLPSVRRMPPVPWAESNGHARRVVVGFDIGSTGSKLVATDTLTKEIVWDGYRQTSGDPVGAAQDLLHRFIAGIGSKHTVVACGVTGSGREVVGSLLTSLFGKEKVFIVNEIVAHATGALHYEPNVDTIFEIGGQDAKYIRLAEGRIIDCAMNEACSAGTGSFIEEQGRKFTGVENVRQLSQAAVGASWGVSLGQHCSVFMAEVIDEAVAAGVGEASIISGLYDSIIQNYLNRVKGNRSIGKLVFCQGMPFSADALSAAVARQTGCRVVVPPNPGTVGALGIALLAGRELGADRLPPFAVQEFLEARVEKKDSFICHSHAGCGNPGNLCRIERLRTAIGNARSCFTWGGGCALHDKGTRKKKLPDLAPDPFREREELLRETIAPFRISRGKPTIAVSEEFVLKGLFPFFTAFLHEAGYDLAITPEAGQDTLKRGIQSASVPFCAPMQIFHGVAEQMMELKAEALFIPMIRSIPRAQGQRRAVMCPVVQASPDVLRWVLGRGNGRLRTSGPVRPDGGKAKAPRLLSPLIDIDEGNLDSEQFGASISALAADLGLNEAGFREAFEAGVAVQREFDAGCLSIGAAAIAFCRTQQIVPVVVLGRNYTIYNRVLNSNVPAILREQGAIGIPVDCYPVDEGAPLFPDMYWGYGHTILRAAHQIRRSPGVYALYCSNYSCGPDSFNLHFASYVMEGKPFAIIETDGHSGDAGTKTRVEAFLHCVGEDGCGCAGNKLMNDFQRVQVRTVKLGDIGRNGCRERLLIPHIGPPSDAATAVLRGLGMDVESLPPPDRDSLQRGRRYTSGKECLPMPLTLGSLLKRLEQADENERFVYMMASTDGPCRFGVYNMLNQIVLDRLGWRDRLRIWSPKDTGYFDDMPIGTEALMFAGVAASEILLQAMLDVRPVECVAGGANGLFERYHARLLRRLESEAGKGLARDRTLWQVLNGHVFGIPELLDKAGKEFAALRGPGRLPLVELTGEIYVRAVDFSNDFIIRELESRGLRVHLSPKVEWINYSGFTARRSKGHTTFSDILSEKIRHRIERLEVAAIGRHLGWPVPPTTTEALRAAKPYINDALEGEAVLTVGGPLCKWRRGEIDAVVCVGPLECMPTKIAEAQYHHVAEREGLLNVTLSFNGEPISTTALDNFAFEVKTVFQRKHGVLVAS